MFEGMFPDFTGAGPSPLADYLAKTYGSQPQTINGGQPTDSFAADMAPPRLATPPVPTPTVQPPVAPSLPLGTGDASLPSGSNPAAVAAAGAAKPQDAMARLAAGLKGIAPVAPPTPQKVSSPNAPVLTKLDSTLPQLMALLAARRG